MMAVAIHAYGTNGGAMEIAVTMDVLPLLVDVFGVNGGVWEVVVTISIFTMNGNSVDKGCDCGCHWSELRCK